MSTDINFEYDGVEYLVDKSAELLNYIQLPDGRILHVTGWIESLPPYPETLAEIVPNDMIRIAQARYAEKAAMEEANEPE